MHYLISLLFSTVGRKYSLDKDESLHIRSKYSTAGVWPRIRHISDPRCTQNHYIPTTIKKIYFPSTTPNCLVFERFSSVSPGKDARQSGIAQIRDSMHTWRMPRTRISPFRSFRGNFLCHSNMSHISKPLPTQRKEQHSQAKRNKTHNRQHSSCRFCALVL